MKYYPILSLNILIFYDLDRWSDFELYTEDSSIDYFFDERENGLLMDVIT
jgi:hypothetical protein